MFYILLTMLFLQDALSAAFNAANQYADTFEPYRVFYRENESSDLDNVRQEDHGKTANIINMVRGILLFNLMKLGKG